MVTHRFFLAYFQILKKYAIVRALSVRLSVCLCRYYFLWGWPIGVVYGSIDSLWPQGLNQGRNFFWTDRSPHGRGPKSNFHTFSYENKMLLVFKKGYESDVGSGEKGVKSAPRPKKCPPTQKVSPEPKSALRPKKCPSTQKVPPTQKSRCTQWSVKIRLPVTQWRLPSFFLNFYFYF